MRRLVVGVALAVACFAAYWAWLGWDHTYQVDPRTGIRSGPYEAWQVAGCVLCLAVAGLAAGLARQEWVAVAVMPIAFTVAWSIPASSDETGQWGVGAFLVFIGMNFGVLLLAWPAAILRGDLQRRNRG